MLNACSLSAGPAGCGGLDIHRIWRVDADTSYDISVAVARPRGLTAVRTVRGAGRMALDGGGPLELPAGSAVVVENESIRHYRTDGERWDFWWFEFAWFGPLHVPLRQAMNVPPEPGEAEAMQSCYDWLGRREFIFRARAGAAFASLLYGWASAWQGRAAHRDPNRALVDRAIDIMRRRLTEPLNVSELAEAEGVSDRWFRKIFADVTGLSPKAWYDAMRLDAAAAILRHENPGLADLAERLGYSSAFHLSRAFKHRFGLPPSRYAAGEEPVGMKNDERGLWNLK
jgi:AraC-like DNA-binding protein